MLQSVLTFVKKNVLVVAFSVLCTTGIMSTCNKSNMNRFQENSFTLTPTTEYQDKNGTTHDVIKVRELTSQEMKYLTDSIRKTIKGKPEIKEVITVVTKLDTIFRDGIVTKNRDTVDAEWKDNYLYVKATLDLKANTGILNLKLMDTLTQVKTFKNRFLKANTTTIDITNKNPYTKIVAGSAITLKEPKSILVFGPGVTFNPVTQQISWGVSLTFNMLSIKSRK